MCYGGPNVSDETGLSRVHLWIGLGMKGGLQGKVLGGVRHYECIEEAVWRQMLGKVRCYTHSTG